jgi:hypothetical protein
LEKLALQQEHEHHRQEQIHEREQGERHDQSGHRRHGGALDLGANSYLAEPSNLDALSGMIRCLRDWIQINHFPPLNAAVMR